MTAYAITIRGPLGSSDKTKEYPPSPISLGSQVSKAPLVEKKMVIGIPAYKPAKYIKNTILNISHQIPKNGGEVIICLNGEQDNTEEIIQEMKKTTKDSLPPISVLSVREKGKTYAHRKIKAETKEEIIFYCDDDIELAPDTLKHLSEDMNDPNIVISAALSVSRLKSNTFFERMVSIPSRIPMDCIDGKCYAIKKSNVPDIPEEVINEDRWLSIMTAGKWKINEHAIVYYELPQTLREYIHRKVRLFIGNLQLESMFKNLKIKAHSRKLSQITTLPWREKLMFGLLVLINIYALLKARYIYSFLKPPYKWERTV